MISDYYNRTNFLYNIVSINNLESILNYGILSKNRIAEHIPHTDISNTSVQSIRDNVFVTKNKRLHDFANLYFNPRNAMLYSRLSEIDYLCILKIDKAVLDFDNTVVSDRNAAVGGAKFMSPIQASKQLDFNLIYSKSWDFEDYREKLRYKAFMMAEVLVYDSVSPQFIKEIWVGNTIAYDKVIQMGVSIPVQIKPYVFFKERK